MKINSYCLLLSFLICGCVHERKKDEVILDFKYKKGPNLEAKDWKYYEIDDDKILIPKDWIQIDNPNTYFYAKPQTEDENVFFVIVKYDKKQIGMTEYLKECYKQNLEDKNEIFTGYTVKRLTFKTKKTYYCEYFTVKSNKKYITFSTLFETDSHIYDIGIKIIDSNTTHIQEIYKNILFNFLHKGNMYFSPNDDLTKIENINLSTL